MIILYNVHKDVVKDELIEKIVIQNDDLEDAKMEIRFSFKGKTGVNWGPVSGSKYF